MAKAQAAVATRFVTEVAPPPVVPVMRPGRKKVPRSLDTIAEDDREELAAAYGPPSSDHHHHQAGFAAASGPQRAAGFVMSELAIRCFSDAHGQQAGPAAGRVAITS
ncbi:unnamed protein product [Urochloa humidicola]